MIFINHYFFIYILKPLILSSFILIQVQNIYIFLEYSNHIKILIFSKNELEIIELVNDNLYLKFTLK
jgi:hypothetical protein